MRPEVVFALILRMLGIESLLVFSPGTRLGSENDSDSTYTTVESLRLL